MSIVRQTDSSHWYFSNGQPCYELPKKSGAGMKNPTLREAKELGLLPSVTTILKVLHKPNLQDWLIDKAVRAVLKTPRMNEMESDDMFLTRVLQVERIQDIESQEARDKGTAIHDAIEMAIQGEDIDSQWRPYVEAVMNVLKGMGKIVWTEKVLVGDGYAGRADALLENDRNITLVDFKTTGKIPPKESYKEHRMQTAAYAKTLGNTADRHIMTANIYISTSTVGQVALYTQEDWMVAYERGFVPLMKTWQYMNEYAPVTNGVAS